MPRPAARRIDPDVQAHLDLTVLMALPEFRRFLFFTVAQKSGICDVANSDKDATFYNGRRSLGLEILNAAEAMLPVRDPASSPFAVIAMCALEAQKLLTLEAIPDDQDETDYERR